MREIDKLECRAVGKTPKQALVQCLDRSSLIWTGEVESRPEAMFGVIPGSVLDGIGHPWLLGTDLAREQRRAFAELAQGYLDRIQQRFPRLENYIATENLIGRAWLRRCGFDFDSEPVYHNGIEMLRFHKGF